MARGFRINASMLLNGQGWHPDLTGSQLAYKGRTQVRSAHICAQRIEGCGTMMHAWTDCIGGKSDRRSEQRSRFRRPCGRNSLCRVHEKALEFWNRKSDFIEDIVSSLCSITIFNMMSY